MKDEREQMQEYLKQYTNANSDIQKPKSVDKAVKGVNKRGRSDWGAAYDAAKRHQRRHPKTESALMLIAGYESEFAY